MDTFKFQDIRFEKANAILRYRRIKRITTLLRFVEVFIFLIVLSRYSTQFAFSLKLSGEYFRGISVTLISPRFVFLIGNAIVIVLFLKSGRFSPKSGETIANFYDEYVEKCRQNQNQQLCIKEEKKTSDTYKYRSGACYGEKIGDKYLEKSRQNQQICSKEEKKVSDTYKKRSRAGNSEKIADFYDEYVEKSRQNQQICSKEEKKVSDTYKSRSGVCYSGRKINRSQSDKLERNAHGDDRHRDLRRSMTEKCRKGTDCGPKAAAAAATYAEDALSSEEFRRTVEAFIARQQRFLREEEEISPVVPLIES